MRCNIVVRIILSFIEYGEWKSYENSSGISFWMGNFLVSHFRWYFKKFRRSDEVRMFLGREKSQNGIRMFQEFETILWERISRKVKVVSENFENSRQFYNSTIILVQPRKFTCYYIFLLESIVFLLSNFWLLFFISIFVN